MTLENRTVFFQALAELCRRYPGWRFGQLVSNVAGWTDSDVWNVEDEQLLAAIRLHLDEAARPDRELRT